MPTAIAAKVASCWTSPLIRKLIYPNQGFTFYPPFSSIKKHGTNATNRSKSDHHFKRMPAEFSPYVYFHSPNNNKENEHTQAELLHGPKSQGGKKKKENKIETIQESQSEIKTNHTITFFLHYCFMHLLFLSVYTDRKCF